MGYETATRLPLHKLRRQRPSLSRASSRSRRARCFKIERLRYLKREPFSLHYSYLQASRFPNIETQDFTSCQLCDLLKREYGLETITVKETLESVLANADESRYLNVGRNHPLLRVDDTFYLASNEPFVVGRSLFRGDKMILSFEYKKEPGETI